MADFQARVQGLTQLTMGSGDAPSTTELSEFLQDGVLDVTDKWLVGHPQDRELFMDETGLQVAQGADVSGAEIISVVRADGVTAGNFRPCRKIPSALQSQVTDTESLSFASKYHPVYMLSSDTTVKVFPAPDDNDGKDSYKVYYINNTPKDSSGTSLTYTDSALGYFPADKVYLVVLYASIQSLQAAMSNSIASLSMLVPSAVVPPYLGKVAIYIEANQDVELASAKLQEVQAGVQNALSIFNGEVTSYQAEVQKEVQEATTKTQQYQGLYAQLFQQYISVFQVAQPQQPGGR